MTKIAFLCLYGLAPVVALRLARRAGVTLAVVSIPSIVLVAYLVFAYIGLPVLYFQWDSTAIAIGASDLATIYRMLLYAATALVALPLGFCLCRLLVPLPEYVSPRASLGTPTARVVGILAVTCLFVFGLYLRRVPGVALFAALKNDFQEQMVLRSEMTNALFEKSFDWQGLFYIDLLQFICFIIFANILVTRNRRHYRYFVPLLLIELFVALSTTQKSPVVFLAAGLLLVYVLTRQNGRITAKNLMIAAGTIATTVLCSYFIIFKNTAPVLLVLQAMVSRIFVGSLSPGYFYLKFFPDVHPFLWGRSLSNPFGFLPFHQYPLTSSIYDFIYPSHRPSGIFGTAPTAYWGEAYANFGPVGPLAVGVLLGVLVYLVAFGCNRLPDSPVKTALIAWMALHLQYLSITSFSNYVLDQHMVFIVLVSLGLAALNARTQTKRAKI